MRNRGHVETSMSMPVRPALPGSEVAHEPGMVFDPFKNLGVLVSGIVVDNHMHHFLLGHPGIDEH